MYGKAVGKGLSGKGKKGYTGEIKMGSSGRHQNLEAEKPMLTLCLVAGFFSLFPLDCVSRFHNYGNS